MSMALPAGAGPNDARLEPGTGLTINGGSSSIRFALFDMGAPLRRLLAGKVDRVGLSATILTAEDASGQLLDSHGMDTVDRALLSAADAQPDGFSGRIAALSYGPRHNS